MNELIKESTRLPGYLPQVDYYGNLIENENKSERLHIYSMTILGILGLVAIIGLVVILETRRDYEYKTRIAELQVFIKTSRIPEKKQPVLNVREILGID